MFNGLYCICIVVYILNSKTGAQKNNNFGISKNLWSHSTFFIVGVQYYSVIIVKLNRNVFSYKSDDC